MGSLTQRSSAIGLRHLGRQLRRKRTARLTPKRAIGEAAEPPCTGPFRDDFPVRVAGAPRRLRREVGLRPTATRSIGVMAPTLAMSITGVEAAEWLERAAGRVAHQLVHDPRHAPLQMRPLQLARPRLHHQPGLMWFASPVRPHLMLDISASAVA
jgi:hypothetical protein